MLRTIAVLLLALVCGFARADDKEVKKRLVHQPLYLRGLWTGDDLHFTSEGVLLGVSKPTSIALSGIDIGKVEVRSDHLSITGRRVGLKFSDFDFQRVILTKKVGKENDEELITIIIDRPASGDYQIALNHVFTSDLKLLEPAAPAIWRTFFAYLSGNEAPPLLNFGGGTIYKVGGAVSEPLVLTQPEPE